METGTPPSFVWEDPPTTAKDRSTGRRTTTFVAVVQELRANPGRWARIASKPTMGQATSLASGIKRGCYGAFTPPGDFEVVSRLVGREPRVYARYTPKDEER